MMKTSLQKNKKFVTNVQERGQVTLPLELRTIFDIKFKQKVIISSTGDTITIKPIKRTLLDSLGKLGTLSIDLTYEQALFDARNSRADEIVSKN